MSISFHYDIDRFRLRDSRIVKRTACRIVTDARRKVGKIDVIFTTDEKLYEINSEFLGHDYYTDIVTFNYNEGKVTNGEIYISAPRIKENASRYDVSLKSEIRRVVFHGILHLCGYKDGTEEERKRMSEMEEMYLALSYAQ